MANLCDLRPAIATEWLRSRPSPSACGSQAIRASEAPAAISALKSADRWVHPRVAARSARSHLGSAGFSPLAWRERLCLIDMAYTGVCCPACQGVALHVCLHGLGPGSIQAQGHKAPERADGASTRARQTSGEAGHACSSGQSKESY